MSTCSLVIDVYYALSQIAVINFPAWSSPVFTVEPSCTERRAWLHRLLTYSNLKKWHYLVRACVRRAYHRGYWAVLSVSMRWRIDMVRHAHKHKCIFNDEMCMCTMIGGRSSRGDYDHDRWPRFYVRERGGMIIIVMYVVVGDQWTAKCERRLIQAIKEKKSVNKACGGLLIARVLPIIRLLP